MQTHPIIYKRHRFPPEIIGHTVWLYARFNLSLREIEELLMERDIEISYETVRRWMLKFGPQIAQNLRYRQARPGDIWHLDEVVVKIAGRRYWLWRAVDQHGIVLEEIVQSKRNTAAAKRLLIRLMKRHEMMPKRIITDKLRSCGAAKCDIAPSLIHWSHKGLNNRAENNHLPFRKRERTMQGFRSPGGLQHFVAIQSAIRNCFSASSRRRSATTIRYHRREIFDAWNAAANIA